MKKLIIILSIALLIILAAALTLFLKPELVITQKNLEWALNRWSPYEQTIEVFEFRHKRLSLLKREIEISVEGLQLKSYKDDPTQISIHLKKMDISFVLFRDGKWQAQSNQLNTIIFDKIYLSLPDTSSDEKEVKKKKDLINLTKTYSLLWKEVIPDFDLIIEQLEIENQDNLYTLPLILKKSKKELVSAVHELQLKATPESLGLTLKNPVHLGRFLLKEEMTKHWQELELAVFMDIQKNDHPLRVHLEAIGAKAQLEAQIPNSIDMNELHLLVEKIASTLIIEAEHPKFIQALLPFMNEQDVKQTKKQVEEQNIEAKIQTRLIGQKADEGEIAFKMKSKIDVKLSALELELHHTTVALLKTQSLLDGDKSLIPSLLLGTQVELTIDQLHQKWRELEDKLLQLPAPLNSLDGDLTMKLAFQKSVTEQIEASFEAHFDLEGHLQDLVLKTHTLITLDPEALTPIGPVQTEVNLERVNLRLPRWQAQANAPQFMPDSRIILPKQEAVLKEQEKNPSPPLEVDLHLKTDQNAPMTMATNLLEKPVRLNFDLKIEKGVIKEGYIEVLPLDLEIFRRKIVLNNLRVEFLAPSLPQIKAQLRFHLPQYLITLNLEGTTDQIRHHFSSNPPLPQSDIYAVLLFGRPMTDLSEGDRAASNQTQQMLSDGILSLSVLYFLSGGPIESIGFNPDTGSVSAQVGISQKSSLTLSTSAAGENSASVRRSLGRGWYIDTSVQNNNQMPHGAQQDYGVLLEKIMAY